jgi:hypothetical protein
VNVELIKLPVAKYVASPGFVLGRSGSLKSSEPSRIKIEEFSSYLISIK